MSRIDYAIPVNDNRSKFGAFIGEFFEYRGRFYKVLQKKPALELLEIRKSQPWIKIACKIVLIFTVILPLIAAVDKLIQMVKWSRYKNVSIQKSLSIPVKKEKPVKIVDVDSEFTRLGISYKDWVTEINGGAAANRFTNDKELLTGFLKKYGELLEQLVINSPNFCIESLQYCPNIKKINILLKRESIDLFNQYVPSTITQLTIAFTGTGTAALKGFSDRLRNLHSLKLSVWLSDENDVKALFSNKKLSKLEELDLTSCGLDDKAIAVLLPLLPSSLKILNLQKNKFTGVGLKKIADCPNLKTLKTLDVRGIFNQVPDEQTVSTLCTRLSLRFYIDQKAIPAYMRKGA